MGEHITANIGIDLENNSLSPRDRGRHGSDSRVPLQKCEKRFCHRPTLFGELSFPTGHPHMTSDSPLWVFRLLVWGVLELPVSTGWQWRFLHPSPACVGHPGQPSLRNKRFVILAARSPTIWYVFVVQLNFKVIIGPAYFQSTTLQTTGRKIISLVSFMWTGDLVLDRHL